MARSWLSVSQARFSDAPTLTFRPCDRKKTRCDRKGSSADADNPRPNAGDRRATARARCSGRRHAGRSDAADASGSGLESGTQRASTPSLMPSSSGPSDPDGHGRIARAHGAPTLRVRASGSFPEARLKWTGVVAHHRNVAAAAVLNHWITPSLLRPVTGAAESHSSACRAARLRSPRSPRSRPSTPDAPGALPPWRGPG